MHSYESLPLGWFTLCLPAKALEATQAFYEKLHFQVVGGSGDDGYIVLANGHVELTLMPWLQTSLPTFRGGDIQALETTLAKRGLRPCHLPGFDPTASLDDAVEGRRRYDPTQWPEKYHADENGQPLDVQCSGDFILPTPIGNNFYFDSVPVERARMKRGARFGSETWDGDGPATGLRFEQIILSLESPSPKQARSFLETLGCSSSSTEALSLKYEHPPIPSVAFETHQAAKNGCSFGLVCSDFDAVSRAAQELKASPYAYDHPDRLRVQLVDPSGNRVFLAVC